MTEAIKAVALAKPAATQTAAVAQTTPNESILRRFNPVRDYFARLAGEEHFLKEASFAAQILAGNKYLAQTSIESQQIAFQALAESGLTLNPMMKLAHFVPRNGRCMLEPSYQGMVKLLTDTGSVRHIEVQAIYENDDCEIDMASDRKVLRHVPYAMRGLEKGAVIAFYSIATLVDGSRHFEFMGRGDVEAIRDTSEGWKAYMAKRISSTPWASNFEEMGRKTIIKRHCKHLPKSDRWQMLAKAIDLDNADYDLGGPNSRPHAQLAAAPTTPEENAAEELKAQVRDALKSYGGADKAKIKAECQAFAASGKVDPRFWEGILERITSAQ